MSLSQSMKVNDVIPSVQWAHIGILLFMANQMKMMLSVTAGSF
jgi:hypothetical protein